MPSERRRLGPVLRQSRPPAGTQPGAAAHRPLACGSRPRPRVRPATGGRGHSRHREGVHARLGRQARWIYSTSWSACGGHHRIWKPWWLASGTPEEPSPADIAGRIACLSLFRTESVGPLRSSSVVYGRMQEGTSRKEFIVRWSLVLKVHRSGSLGHLHRPEVVVVRCVEAARKVTPRKPQGSHQVGERVHHAPRYWRHSCVRIRTGTVVDAALRATRCQHPFLKRFNTTVGARLKSHSPRRCCSFTRST